MIDNADYFRRQAEQGNREFWKRIGRAHTYDKRILEIGCGHGALTLEMAKRGAHSVVGIDIDESRIAFARENLNGNNQALAAKVRFESTPLADLDETFDAVVSKDAFEHIIDLEGMMTDIMRVLEPGGVLLTGFGPLYYSPFGDHRRHFGRRVPWVFFIPDFIKLRYASKRYRRPIKNQADMGLNRLTPARFRRIIREQGWEIVSLKYNAGTGALMAVMRVLRLIPIIEPMFTTSIYAVLRRPD